MLKIELPEDNYAHAPFIRGLPEPCLSHGSFEFCYHRGQPSTEPRSGRMVQFEHVVRDVPPFVRHLEIHIGAGNVITIHSQNPNFVPAPRGKRA